jgi:hypothetical protein
MSEKQKTMSDEPEERKKERKNSFHRNRNRMSEN